MNEKQILKLYDSGMSATAIGKKIGRFTTSITRILKRNNRHICTNKGSDHPNWKGGRGIKTGYMTVYKPEHHRANNISRVFEHILIMEKALGRPIKKSEPIHHIDFNRLNNEIHNLYLCKNNSEHQRVYKTLHEVVGKLINKGVIKFKNGKYFI